MTEGKGTLEANIGNWLADLGSTQAAVELLTTVEGLLNSQGP